MSDEEIRPVPEETGVPHEELDLDQVLDPGDEERAQRLDAERQR